MKRYWQPLALKVDALTLRERAIIFTMVALFVVVLMNLVLLDPQFSRQKQLSQKTQQDQAQIAGIQAEIQQKVKLQGTNPDAVAQDRLQKLKQQAALIRTTLLKTQKDLVSPEKMAALLEDILKRNGKLRLISLKTLPPGSFNETAANANSPAAALSPDHQGNPSIYKHGVEIMVEGGYLDMLEYMAALEAMPWQLFWSKARLNVEEYPRTTLVLTLFTYSLDKKWLAL